MKRVFQIKIYIDILFAVNFFINLFLLYITSLFLKENVNKLRVICASFFGAVYACMMFFPNVKMLFSFVCKLISSFIIVLIAYKKDKFIMNVKKTLVFYLTSFLFGGITFFLIYFLGISSIGTCLSNGIFYFNIPVYLFLLSSSVAYFFVHYITKIYEFNKKTSYKNVKVCVGEKTAYLTCLVDTGNLLKDHITGDNVIVAEIDAIKSVIDENTYNLLKGEYSLNNENTQDIKIHIIPFSSLGNMDGVLLGFKPDFVVIDEMKRENIIIGVYNKKLSHQHSYNALIGAV